jgi:phosphatidylserine decarboxylase
LPKQALTALAGKLAAARAGGLTTAVIRWFVGRYGVNMAEAANPDIASYASFNEFFTRPLRARVRPLAERTSSARSTARSASSADRVRPDLPGQGPRYSTTALVGGDRRAGAARFENGDFATLYLSPRDYHRIHMPCAGRLRA